jgi:predicted glycosyltransferase
MRVQRTVLFHPLNHIGLGHINRLSVIALALRELDNHVRTPFAVEEASHVLLDTLGLPYVPLPSSHTMADGTAWAAWTKDERSTLQIAMARSVLKIIAPQVVVFDCLPNPSFAEAVLMSKIPIVLCLREMRDLASYISHAHSFLEHAKLIIIPHSEGTICLPETLAAKSRFVGQVARLVHLAALIVRDSEKPHILITGGGGGYPGTVEFYNLALRAVADLRHRFLTLKAELIAGPLFRDWLLLQPGHGTTLIPFEPDIISRFVEADLVICQAGYNTVAELGQLGTKTVLVPAERQWDDQFARANRVVRERRNFRVFRGGSPTELAQLATKLLTEPIPGAIKSKPEGGIKAARLIYELMR